MVRAVSTSVARGTPCRSECRTMRGSPTPRPQNTNRHHFAYKPNLVVVDGGKPQVMAAAKALEDCGVNDVAVCGLAKRSGRGVGAGRRLSDHPQTPVRRHVSAAACTRRIPPLRHHLPPPAAGAKAPCAACSTTIPGIGESYQKRLLNHLRLGQSHARS